MKWLMILALVVGLYPCIGRGADQHQSFWSEGAKVFKAKENGSYESILSPDGEIRLSFNGAGFTFQDKQGKVLAQLQDSISTPELLEVGWSPDANDVFINASDGGASGTWSTRVFKRSDAGLREIPIEKLIEKVSTLRSDCRFKNVGAVAWIEGHRNLLVLEQVPDSSGCTNMGKVVGYVLDVVTPKVLERLNAEQVKARFHSQLGIQGQAAVE